MSLHAAEQGLRPYRCWPPSCKWCARPTAERNRIGGHPLEISSLHAQRLQNWCQTPESCITGPEAAAELIRHVGIATLFAASPEAPNLFHAYMGDPEAETMSEWDSPSGEVYGWRWTLGRQEAAFYTALVRARPTWVSWDLLPSVLRLRGELRPPEELYAAGELSVDALRITQALQDSGGVLATGELRARAGFPTGKEQRAAYLKAVQELDTRLLLAKVFSADSDDMSHALVRLRYPRHVEAAEEMSPGEALEHVLRTYLPHAVYAVPAVLARHLKLPEATLREGFDRLVSSGLATPATLPGQKGTCYVWEHS